MNPRGRVTERLRALIARQLDARGLVVWYDPQQAYGETLDCLDLQAAVVRYKEGFLRLRRLESVLE